MNCLKSRFPALRLALLLLVGLMTPFAAKATTISTTPEQIVALSSAADGRFLASTPDYRFQALGNGADFSAAWVQEKVSGLPDYVRIRAAATGAYLYVQNGQLRLGPIQEDWLNALWRPDAAGAGTLIAGETLGGVWVPYALGLDASGTPIFTNLSQGWPGNGQAPLQFQWVTQSHPPAAPGTANQQPAPDTTPYPVALTNPFGQPLTLFWTTPDGQQQRLGELPAGSTTDVTANRGTRFQAMSIDAQGRPINGPFEYTVQGLANETAVLGQNGNGTTTASAQGGSRATSQPLLVTLVFQNASNGPVDIFFDNPQGDQEFLMTLDSGMELEQQSPAGAVWRLANDTDWLDSVRATDAPTQVVRYPEGARQ